MATQDQNLSDFSFSGDCSDYLIGIVVSEWNYEITGNLLEGAKATLKKYGVSDDNVVVYHVPGTFELPLGCQNIISQNNLDGVIAIGSVIQGETRHFDFVCEGATQGIMNVMLVTSTPISFCVLTDNTKQQALDRSGGKHGNKGDECAVACLKMIAQGRG